MSRAQDLLRSTVSAERYAEIEAETRLWIVECNKCGDKRNTWDMGGVKYKAYGTSWTWGRCPVCNRIRRFRVYKSTP